MAEKPTCISSTKNYNLNLFPDTEEVRQLTFKEFRKWLTGENIPGEESTIQQIDVLLKELAEAINQVRNDSESYTDNVGNTIRKDLLDIDENHELIINPTNGRPINFDDGTNISKLENGQFTVGSVIADDIDLGNYKIQYIKENDHLQILYQAKNNGGDE